jgi:DNA-binding winged helix-turn-helix (wHTH) protein/TolB-like protein
MPMADKTTSHAHDYKVLNVGDWQVSPGACTVEKNGDETKITPRSMDVLKLLIERAGTVVSPGELLETIWRSPIATDHAVHKAIAELRSALQDNAHNPSYIKTIPKRGYTLIAPVSVSPSVTPQHQSPAPGLPASDDIAQAQAETDESSTQKASTGTPPAGSGPASRWTLWRKLAVAAMLSALIISAPPLLRSPESTPEADGVVQLAVMPFASRDFSDENQILAEGIRESLIHGLSRLRHLQVLSPARNAEVLAASQRFDSSYLQQADHILQGSVMTSDGRLRVIVELVRASDGLREYSDQFDLPMNDIFAVQDQIVSNVTGALRVYLNETERTQMRDWGTTNALAYEHFLRGEFYNNQFSPADWERAIESHQAAIELDPAFLNAYHGVATAANNLAVYSGAEKIEQMYQLVLDTHRKISQISPDSDILDSIHAIKLRMRGSSYIQQEMQLREQILSDNPPHFALSHYALLLIGARLYDEAERFLAQATEAGPFEISPDEAWSYRLNILTPADSVMARKNQLQQRPYHVAFLGSVAVNLATLGDFRQAQIYLNQQREVDQEGILAHYTETIMGVLAGDIQADTPSYFAALREHPDFYYNNGVLAFMVGDIARGVHYWQNLQPVHLRRLFNVTHAAEKYFPDRVLRSPEYQALLDSLGAGLDWQRRLMEGVMAMESVTGVGLSRRSQEAYDEQRLMITNNLWSEQDWSEHQHYLSQRLAQASTLNAARVH